jgi:hypothetical protein
MRKAYWVIGAYFDPWPDSNFNIFRSYEEQDIKGKSEIITSLHQKLTFKNNKGRIDEVTWELEAKKTGQRMISHFCPD